MGVKACPKGWETMLRKQRTTEGNGPSLWFGPGLADTPLSQASAQTSYLPVGCSMASFERESWNLTLSPDKVVRLNY